MDRQSASLYNVVHIHRYLLLEIRETQALIRLLALLSDFPGILLVLIKVKV